jgi:hypothetical protein
MALTIPETSPIAIISQSSDEEMPTPATREVAGAGG